MTLDRRLTRAVHQVADLVPVPEVDLAVIRSTARARQRRRTAVAAVAAVAVVAVGVGVAGAAVSGGGHSEQPARQPSREPSPSASGSWTPERIRAEGSPGEVVAVPGLMARIYTVCDGPGCNSDGGGPSEYKHRVLEVAQVGSSALFEVSGIGSQGPWIRVFDDDSVFVEDTDVDGVWPEGPARFRLLQVDGTEVALRLIDDPAPMTAGAATVLVDDFQRHGGGMGGGQRLYVVDERARTLRPLEREAVN